MSWLWVMILVNVNIWISYKSGVFINKLVCNEVDFFNRWVIVIDLLIF